MSGDEPEIVLKPTRPTSGGPVGRSRGRDRIIIDQSVLLEMDEHVQEDTSVEHGGVMVGHVDEVVGATVIIGSIRAVDAVSEVASLRFTHSTWDHVSAVMDEEFADEQIVGWYHSHPHFGIFLSDHDLFIHRNFFPQPWQVAYVRDPLLDERGFFVWENGDVVPSTDWSTESDSPAPPRGAIAEGRPDGTRARRRRVAFGLAALVLAGAAALVGRAVVGGGSGDGAVDASFAPGGGTGPGGSEFTIGEVVVDGAPVEARVEADVAAASGGGGDVPVVVEAADSTRFPLVARPPVGMPAGDYTGSVAISVCDPSDDCDAIDEEVPFQLSVTDGPLEGASRPAHDRWQAVGGDDPDSVLRVLDDEVLVLGDAPPELEQSGAVLVGRPLPNVLSQIAWPPGVPPLTSVLEEQSVDKHYGLAGPQISLRAEEVRDRVARAGLESSPGDVMPRVGFVGVASELESATCDGSCAETAVFDHRPSVEDVVGLAEITGSMAEAASESDIVVVAVDAPVCGDPDASTSSPFADIVDTLSVPVRGAPDVLWLVAAQERPCPPGTTTPADALAAFDNVVVAAASRDPGQPGDGKVSLEPDGLGEGYEADVTATAIVARLVVDGWPGAIDADVFAECIEDGFQEDPRAGLDCA